MSGGYVLNFSNRTLEEFIRDSTGRSIYDPCYEYASSSKANRLRAFWIAEGNTLVGKLMGDMLDYCVETGCVNKDDPMIEECRRIVVRLVQNGPVVDLDALTAISNDIDFEAVAKAVRETIDKNQPEVGLDRLHTFATKYVRSLCQQRGIAVTRDKALHSLFGEYVKCVRDMGQIESEMTLRILKSSISTLEAFNDVRNNQSLTHDNPMLNYDEALLIFNHVASSIRFLRNLESKIARREQRPTTDDQTGDIPF